jgi:hypothetical protein
MEVSSELISILALVFSIIAFIITFIYNRELAKKNMRHREAIFHMERNAEFEGKLAEWPEAFKFYGIDLHMAEKDDISKEQITFLIMSINALSSICQAKGESIYEQIKNSDYRKRMFSQKETRKAWKYARECFTEYSRRDIDRYLKETYPDESDECEIKI